MKNKILLGLLIFLLSCMIGYALFSESIAITGTATASGNFSINVTCQPGILSKLGTVQSLGLNKEGGYQNDTCSVKNNKISVSTEFLYPTAHRYFTVKIKNTGTIDIKYDAAKITSTDKICVANNIAGNNKKCKTLTNADSQISLEDYRANFGFYRLAVEKPNGDLLTEEEVMEFYDPVNEIFIAKPGYSVYWYAYLWLEHSNENNGDMFVEYESSFEIPLIQATN